MKYFHYKKTLPFYPCKRCDNRRLRTPEVVRDHLLKMRFVENYYDWYLHKSSEAGPRNVVVPEEQQQNTVQNSYVKMVYDAAVSNFPDIHHHFLPQSYIVVFDVPQSPLHIEEDSNPQTRQFFDNVERCQLTSVPYL